MYRTRKPVEELALDLLFDSLGEHRYNRTPEQYRHLCKLIPPLKEAHYLVNQRLKELHEMRAFQSREICDFKVGDRVVLSRPYPKTISIETLRNALTIHGFRDPRWRKRKAS